MAERAAGTCTRRATGALTRTSAGDSKRRSQQSEQECAVHDGRSIRETAGPRNALRAGTRGYGGQTLPRPASSVHVTGNGIICHEVKPVTGTYSHMIWVWRVAAEMKDTVICESGTCPAH